MSEGDQYSELANKSITGFFKLFYDYQKAFDYFILAGKSYSKENKTIKSVQAYKDACFIYESNFDEKKKIENKQKYNEIINQQTLIANMFFRSIPQPKIDQHQSANVDDEDIK